MTNIHFRRTNVIVMNMFTPCSSKTLKSYTFSICEVVFVVCINSFTILIRFCLKMFHISACLSHTDNDSKVEERPTNPTPQSAGLFSTYTAIEGKEISDSTITSMKIYFNHKYFFHENKAKDM